MISGEVYLPDNDPAIASTISDSDTILHVVLSRDCPQHFLYYTRDHYIVGIEEGNAPTTPGAISLYSYPNPFNSSSIISFSNLEDDEIKIFDIKGSLVRILKPEQMENGSVIWDATDDGGQKESSGIYFAKATCRGGPACPPNLSVIKLIYLK